MLLTAHLGAAAGAMLVLPLPSALLVIAALGVGAREVWRWLGSSASGSVVEIEIDSNGEVRLRLASGDLCAARLRHASILAPWFVAVVFHDESGCVKPVLVFPRRTSFDALRRLRAWAVHSEHAAIMPGTSDSSFENNLGGR